ncbi:hypothetical protein HELRODRAFT_182327 [Helobdella robusta]|uniref:Uncharacterized protein n=1 Tax=Helobdella robusta TaxID=6412 RepID=T1FI25_HELRO|nr:hypothetical protein HELRODRAFT_182327 [Helobdella robusta]ESN91074.1 hypothetical protein HELRODRAFT_182327 [Helobdella robusta]
MRNKTYKIPHPIERRLDVRFHRTLLKFGVLIGISFGPHLDGLFFPPRRCSDACCLDVQLTIFFCLIRLVYGEKRFAFAELAFQYPVHQRWLCGKAAFCYWFICFRATASYHRTCHQPSYCYTRFFGIGLGESLPSGFFHVFDRLTVVLRTAHLYDHVPKPCRDKVSKALSALLTAVCDDPCDAAHWCRLQCFFAFVLFKPTRGGRRTNQANCVIKRLAEFSSTEVEIIVASFNTDHNTKPRKHNPNSWISAVTTRIEQGSFSAAVRLACSPAGLAESSPETLAKLKAIHPSAPLNRRAFPAQEPSNGHQPRFALELVSLLPVHDALTIIRGALSLPKLMYFLRTSNSVNAAILGALTELALKELSGIAAHDGKRPDECTLISWRAGRCLAWDVTVPGTFAERYVQLTSKESGLAATRASDEKIKKYDGALPSMKFLPICIEVLGPMDRNTSGFFNRICKHISIRSGDSREYFFAMNNISCILQRFLHVCVLKNVELNADEVE